MIAAIEQFRSALLERGIIPDEIIADGQMHRCNVHGKHGAGDGAYVLHLDGPVPAGGFQNWQDGQGWQDWRGDIGRDLTPSEKDACRQRAAAQRAAREEEEDRNRRGAAYDAETIVTGAKPCSSKHGYSIAFGNFKKGYTVIEKPFSRFLPDPYTDKPYVRLYAHRYVGGAVHNFEAIKLVKFATT